MQTYQIEISDNIADKILWFLNSFKDDIKINMISKKEVKKFDTSHIEIMSEAEKQDIINTLNNISSKGREIDKKATIVVEL